MRGKVVTIVIYVHVTSCLRSCLRHAANVMPSFLDIRSVRWSRRDRFSGLLPSCTGTSVGDLPCFSQINLRLETSVFCQGYQGVTYLATRKSNRTRCGAADSVSRLETREVGDRAITVDGPDLQVYYFTPLVFLAHYTRSSIGSDSFLVSFIFLSLFRVKHAYSQTSRDFAFV